MERNHQKNGLTNLLLLFATGIAAFTVALYTKSVSGQIAAGFLGLGVLVALISWFQMRLEERERIEKLEFDELAKGGASSSTLFNTQDAEGFPARRSREQFEKFFVPGFTVLLLLVQGFGAWWFWRWIGKLPAAPTLNQPLVGMAIFGMLALVLFLLGQFSTGLARLEKHRLLQPGASQVLLGAYLLALVVAAIAAVQSGFDKADLIGARVLVILLGLLAIENLLTLLLEIYRPRIKGKVGRLLYDSRVVGLVSHPEGIFTTVAHTLDYQFGFKVSDTWFYQFMKRSMAWLVFCYLLILAASTSLVYVQPGEEALLERFGQPVAGREVLGPGFHAKMPWPIDAALRFRTQEIQSFDIGIERDLEKERDEAAILWTVSHYKQEFNLLVASREPNGGSTNSVTGKKAPPVNLLSVSIPVQYQIQDVRAWAYNYNNAGELLKQLATREVVRYFVGIDVNEIMSTARFTAGDQLRQRIQAQADELKLGVQVLFVGLQDVHPPVAVGGAYEKSVGAKQTREANILKARAYAIRTNALAIAESTRRKLTASAASTNKIAAALATESLFTNQMAAFKASPEVYAQRSYLQTLAKNSSDARKFVVAVSNANEVIMLNMEDKIRDDLLNITVPPPKTK
ncbi:MAG: protease modulator HflK [Verrucomicrobia bacterium]|nr:protease modulator HflK [Verrucomicrobiota bacterium]